jgi:hypothetical protein
MMIFPSDELIDFLLSTKCSKVKRIRILVDVVRRAEKDYLAKDVPFADKMSAKRVLFKEPWFKSLCSCLGIDVEIARLHILQWKAKGKVGDPVFGFLSEPGAYDNYVEHHKLSLPTLANLMDGFANGRNSGNKVHPSSTGTGLPGAKRN